MIRTCKRCGLKMNHDLMHYNKQMKGWLCNDRERCSVALECIEQKRDKPWKRWMADD